jgi:hypothetical protein
MVWKLWRRESLVWVFTLYREYTPITVNVSISILIHWRTCENSMYWGWKKGWKIVLYNFSLPNDGPDGPKHVAVCLLKHYGNSKEECAFVDLRCNILVWSGRNLSRFYLHFQNLPLCALPLPLPPFILQNSKILLPKKGKAICPLSYPENDKLSPETLLKFLPDFTASHSRRQSVFSKCLSIFGAVCTNSLNGSTPFQMWTELDDVTKLGLNTFLCFSTTYR